MRPILAPTFRAERWIARLLRANGVLSLGAAAVCLRDLTWVQSPLGLGFYAAWNLLVIAVMALVAARFRTEGPVGSVVAAAA